jgi:hypothetical protein
VSPQRDDATETVYCQIKLIVETFGDFDDFVDSTFSSSIQYPASSYESDLHMS